MNAAEIIRIVEALHKDKDIDKEIIFRGIEEALISASRKRYGTENVEVVIDRVNGTIHAKAADVDVDPGELGCTGILTGICPVD